MPDKNSGYKEDHNKPTEFNKKQRQNVTTQKQQNKIKPQPDPKKENE